MNTLNARYNAPDLPPCHLMLLTKLYCAMYWKCITSLFPCNLYTWPSAPCYLTIKTAISEVLVPITTSNLHITSVLLSASPHCQTWLFFPYFPHRLHVNPGCNKYPKSDFTIEYWHLKWLIEYLNTHALPLASVTLIDGGRLMAVASRTTIFLCATELILSAWPNKGQI